MNPREMSEREKLIDRLHEQGLTDWQILSLVLMVIGEPADSILRMLVNDFEEDK